MMRIRPTGYEVYSNEGSTGLTVSRTDTPGLLSLSDTEGVQLLVHVTEFEQLFAAVKKLESES